jgi:cupin superfamily acireductone dioxygenase involved in methionine salvage
MMKDMIIYRCKEQHNTTTEEINMILTGKALFNYRMNQIKKFALMFTSVFSVVSFLMLMCAVYG